MKLLLQALICVSIVLTAGTLFAEERTSENNAQLKQGLERFPQADSNGDGVLTATEAREFIAKRRQQQEGRAAQSSQKSDVPAPTHADVEYGPYDRNRLDLWIAESDEPTPLLVLIHGGGFSGGSKEKFRNSPVIAQALEKGVSVAAINYRLTEGGKNPFPIPMLDGARAIQFLRYKADEYNLDKQRIGASGGSAGGCMSLWLALHDDLADPKSDDPVLRESTRLVCAGPNAGQSCLDFDTLHEWFGVEKLREHGGGRPLFAIKSDAEIASPRVKALMKEASAINHLTKDDPPVYMNAGRNVPIDETSSPGAWVHHPMMGIKLKEAADRIGVECYNDYVDCPPIEKYEDQTEFLLDKLLN